MSGRTEKRPCNYSYSQIETFRLGSRVAKNLDPVMTFDEIAAELGVSRGRVWQITCLALGKVARQMQKRGWYA